MIFMGLAHDELGSGAPLLVLPGGPLLAPSYLGDLGGLPARLHLRGTGRSGPADLADPRFDVHVDDVEAYRAHAGPAPVDVLAHAARLAALPAARRTGAQTFSARGADRRGAPPITQQPGAHTSTTRSATRHEAPPITKGTDAQTLQHEQC